jgi:hypothetical protein
MLCWIEAGLSISNSTAPAGASARVDAKASAPVGSASILRSPLAATIGLFETLGWPAFASAPSSSPDRAATMAT